MHSFYMLEGSFHQGSGGWEDIYISDNVAELDEAATEYVRTGNWVGARDDFVVRVFQAGLVVVEQDIYPFLRLKLPGLTEIRFRSPGRPHGGHPERKSEHPAGETESEDTDGSRLEDLLADVFAGAAEHRPEDVHVSIDWPRLMLPELIAPRLPKGVGVFIRKDDDEQWGEARAAEASSNFGQEDDPDLLFEERFGWAGCYFAYGYNAPGYNDWRP